jgi:hypothetical protein
MQMLIDLVELPNTVLGCYKDKVTGAYLPLPARMRFLHPDAAKSFLAIDAGPYRIRVSDMFRSPLESLRARAEKKGVQPPGYSAHNYGFAIDVDLDWTMKAHGWTKAGLNRFMESHGWYCHRADDLGGFEAWHFNYFGREAARYLPFAGRGTRDKAVERKMQDYYGKFWLLSPEEVQGTLKSLKLYSGEIDGKIGPVSREAIMAFQRQMKLTPTGEASPQTKRMLAISASEKNLVVLAAA